MLPGLQANQLARPTARTSQAKRAGVYFFEAPHCARLGDGNGARTLSAGKNKQMEGIFKVASHIAPPCKKGLYLLNVWRSTSGFGEYFRSRTRGRSPERGAAPRNQSPRSTIAVLFAPTEIRCKYRARKRRKDERGTTR